MGSRVRVPYAPPIGSLAQLNRAFDYGSKGYRFESYRSHFSISEVSLQKKKYNVVFAKMQIPHFFVVFCGMILKEYLKIFRPINLLIIFVSERRPRCDRISPQTRSYLLPDAFVSRPRCDCVSTQMRLCLLPDALKSIGLEIRGIMRLTSTVVARKR